MNKEQFEKMIDEKLVTVKKEMMKKFEEKREDDFPKIGDGYWYICADGEVYHDSWDRCPIDIGRFSMGNIFLTEKEAEFEAERRKVIKELEKYAEPKDRAWDEDNRHCSIGYNYSEQDFDYCISCTIKCGEIYFESKKRQKKLLNQLGKTELKNIT